jgi:hypothetical protein
MVPLCPYAICSATARIDESPIGSAIVVARIWMDPDGLPDRFGFVRS